MQLFNLKHYETKKHIATIVGYSYKRTNDNNFKSDTLEIFDKEGDLICLCNIVGLVDDDFKNNSLNVYVVVE